MGLAMTPELVNPVPVKVTTVPTGALIARAEGDAETIAGPVTVKALADSALAIPLFNTSTPSVPASAPVPTMTFAVMTVPVEFTEVVNVTPPSAVVDVPLKASTTLPEPKPEPVMVNVSGTVPEVPGTIGAFGLRA